MGSGETEEEIHKAIGDFKSAIEDHIKKFKEDPHNIPIYPPSYINQSVVLLQGFAGRDVFGRTYIDKCKNDEDHLTKAEVPPGKERPGCRFYLSDLLPSDVLGSEVEVTIEVKIRRAKDNG